MLAQSKIQAARGSAVLVLWALMSVGCEPSASAESGSDAPGALQSEVVAPLAYPKDCDDKFRFLAGAGDAPHQVLPGAEGYQSFEFDVPWGAGGAGVQAVAIRPVVDNHKVVHHFTLYDGKGAHLAHWAPGGESEPLPDDVGRFLPPAGKLRLEIHYYNKAGTTAEADRTGFEVCTTRTPRAHTAGMYPFVALPMALAGRVSSNSAVCTVTSKTPVRVISASPHMHKLGVHAKLELLRPDGTAQVLHDRPFSFESQDAYPLDLTLQPGDRVRTTCTYQNPSTRNVTFGLGSDDEMCFNFVLYHPLCGLSCSHEAPELDFLADSQNGECAAAHAHPDGGTLP